MNCFRYKLEHDFGFAPNPFHGYLTLAACKGQIRGNPHLQQGDWIVGLGSIAMGNEGHIIYAMMVEEILTFDEYWADRRFICKKPVLNGSLVMMYGDNVYHHDPESGSYVQEPCAHSNEDGSVNDRHLRQDTKCINVLISRLFYYFGNQCPILPKRFMYISADCRDYQYKDISGKNRKINAFVNWLKKTYRQGIHGEPCNWKKFKRPEMLLPNLSDHEEE